MTATLDVLIIENDPVWRDLLRQALARLGGPVRIDAADDLGAARSLLDRATYHLATVDISLMGDPPRGQEDELGLSLVDSFFQAERHLRTAILMVTGYNTSERMERLLQHRHHRVSGVVEKRSYNEDALLDKAKRALLDVRNLQAEERSRRQYRLLVWFGRQSWLASELRGPGYAGSYQADPPMPLQLTELAKRADRLNVLLRSGGPAMWREEARDLGRTLSGYLQADPCIAAHLASALALSNAQNPLLLRFSGPAVGLGLPFELMRNGDDYLCFHHQMERQLTSSPGSSRRPQRFADLVRDLRQREERLRVLLIGANADGKIPMVKGEVEIMGRQIEIEAARLGIRVQIEARIGPDAELTPVKEALSGGDFHIFHYAGHGRFDDSLPEVSGLVLGEGEGMETLTAQALGLLVENTPLQFVFLNCCVGARTAQQTARGDFYGTLEALARAGVPAVLGHRWTVSDSGAVELAQAFYQSLWESLSPSWALLEARRNLGIEFGRDEATWASPVLLCQTD